MINKSDQICLRLFIVFAAVFLSSSIVAVGSVSLETALGQPTWSVVTGGTADWFGQDAITRDGESAAQSGSITDSQESWVETEVEGPGTLDFWWKVSSEENYDWLEFHINGSLQDGISGETDWQQKSYILAEGTNTLRWRYVKDVSLTLGEDAGWVNGVQFTPVTEPTRVIILSGDLAFGNMTVGHTVSRILTIQNSGNTTLIVDSISYPTGFSGDWDSGSIAAGASQEITVTFAPAAAQSYDGILAVVSNATSGDETRAISGVGLDIVPLETALGQPTWLIVTGGSEDWYGQGVVTRNGGSAAQSGSITDEQQSWIEVAVQGPGTLSFWWKVSSELSYDWLEFFINGALTDGISGESVWEEKSYTLSEGLNTLRWVYLKDSSISVGQDAGWVEGLTWISEDFSAYSQWIAQLGLSGEESAVLYRHGPVNLSNLEAFAMGLDPRTAKHTDLPRVVTYPGSETELVFRYRANTAATGVVRWFEGSDDLSDWEVREPLHEDVVDSEESIEIREATFALGTAEFLFIRMAHSLPTPP